jgi:hypothetical protein
MHSTIPSSSSSLNHCDFPGSFRQPSIYPSFMPKYRLQQSVFKPLSSCALSDCSGSVHRTLDICISSWHLNLIWNNVSCEKSQSWNYLLLIPLITVHQLKLSDLLEIFTSTSEICDFILNNTFLLCETYCWKEIRTIIPLLWNIMEYHGISWNVFLVSNEVRNIVPCDTFQLDMKVT